MSSQIFKNTIPINLLTDLLEKICVKEKNKYIIDPISFKKAQINNLIQPFCKDIESYYQSSKKYYITRNLNYNKFITIIRHICKSLNILYISQIKYINSNYTINYYIYI